MPAERIDETDFREPKSFADAFGDLLRTTFLPTRTPNAAKPTRGFGAGTGVSLNTKAADARSAQHQLTGETGVRTPAGAKGTPANRGLSNRPLTAQQARAAALKKAAESPQGKLGLSPQDQRLLDLTQDRFKGAKNLLGK